jgi:putative peptide maturation system protein
MDETFPVALRDTLACLLTLGRDRVPPALAREAFQRLEARHPDVPMDLVWEEEGSGTVHYDALLDAPQGGTVSLAFCPDRGLPWALRHAHHAREADVLRVNGRTLNVHTIMGYLDVLWDDARLLTRLVDGCLMLDGIEAHAIEVSAAETRKAIGAFRQWHRLGTAEAIQHWLARRGWTHDDLEYELTRQVAAAKLRERLVGARVDIYFAQHRADLDRAEIARLRVDDAKRAARLCGEIRRGAIGFFDALQERFLAGHVPAGGGALEVVRRRQLSPRDAALIFGASPGDVVGPLPRSDGYQIVRVLRVRRARLDAETREAIRQTLFEEWLAERRREAAIEWFWGEADRVPPGPAPPLSGRGA